MKKVRIVLSTEAEEVYLYLKEKAPVSKTERMILKSVDKKVEYIKVNPHFGDPISKKLIPEDYKENYNISNLFRVELPNFWRMLYTLTNGDTDMEIIAFILDVIDHKKYNKKFGYKNK